MQQQPNFTVGNQQAIPGSEYDNLTPQQLQQLINQAHKLRTGREGRIHSTTPPPEKKHVDLTSIFGGL